MGVTVLYRNLDEVPGDWDETDVAVIKFIAPPSAVTWLGICRPSQTTILRYGNTAYDVDTSVVEVTKQSTGETRRRDLRSPSNWITGVKYFFFSLIRKKNIVLTFASAYKD